MIIQDILPAGIFLGTSLILRNEGRFLFGVRPPKQIAGQTVLEITGIGGRLEPFDPNLSAGVMREACEEISSRINLLPCSRTVVVRGPSDIQEVRLEDKEQPAAIVFRAHRTPPHNPWHPDHQDTGCIIVFLAELLGLPTPSPEIPFLIWLSPQQIISAAKTDLPIGSYTSNGAKILVGPIQMPAPITITRLTDSQEALALALGKKAAIFYQSLL